MRILVIEDNPGLARGLRETLRSVGHDTRWARDCEQAERLLGQEEFDACVCDLELPDATGPDALARVRESPGCATLPLVAVSDLPLPELTHAAATWSAVALQKPFGLVPLVEALEQAGAGRERP